MPRSPNTPCSTCGKLCWPTKKPKGEPHTCRACARVARPPVVGPTADYDCAACGVRVTRLPTKGQRPKWCPDCRSNWRLIYGRAGKCAWCDTAFVGAPGQEFCSRKCYAELRRKPRPPKRVRPAKPIKPDWRTPRECPGCAGIFCPMYTPSQVTCSRRCAKRVHRWRRRASEANAVGAWVWSDFMRIAQRFGFCCAYCGDRFSGQLEPDHVVPLSRGGYNSTANLLPACRSCNSDKRDLLLSEWADDRLRRGLPPRLTAWAPEDRRFSHLTQATLAGVA